jgi:tRNA (guanine-N7-)-methyltransferase
MEREDRDHRSRLWHYDRETMGRRALRKIDEGLDLSRHFREASELAPAFDQTTLFEVAQRLEVEVGSGKGLFLAGTSRAQPGRNFLGIEVARKYARFAAARLAKQNAVNAVMICGDALVLFKQWFPAASLAAVHVYFPDPWWKKRHKKRRVMNEDFLRDVERTLASDGRLHFWTDVEEYFQTTLELIASTARLEGPLAVAVKPAEHDLDYRTHFERRTRKGELPVYRAEFVKDDSVS